MLRLADVLDQTDFGLSLLTGGVEARDRAVAGAHNSEMPKPSRFLPRDWVMLTLGLKLRGQSAAQRALIVELDEAGLCGLGFGVGVAFVHVPRALLQEADARGFPVFEIPFETPYRNVIGFVNRSLLSSDYRLLQRTLSMQNYLMDALRETAPVDALVQRLGELLDSTILIYNAHGRVEAASRAAPAEKIWEGVQTHGTGLQRTVVDGSNIVSIPIGAAGQPRRWLVVASRRRSVPRPLALSVIQSTERLLELVTLSQRASAADDRVVRAELLASALEPQGRYASAELQARLKRYGLDFTGPTRILAIDPASRSDAVVNRARVALEAMLGEEGAPYLMAVRGRQLIVLVQVGRERIDEWLRSLAEAGEELLAGGGRSLAAVTEVPQSLRDARVALQQLNLRGTKGLLLFEDFGLASWLVGITPQADMAAKVDSVLGTLPSQPALYETLVVFLQEHLNVVATADALNLHPNSLRYRLRRIEELLGRSLKETATIVDLYVATLARRTGDEVPNGVPEERGAQAS